jgi:protein SCO1/2
VESSWPFWVGDAAAIDAITHVLGFAFLRDPRTGAFAHPAVAFVLTPDGKVSRYLYGIDYPPRDLKLALLEASEGKIGTVGDRILLRCFHYDPTTRRYGLFVTRFMQVGGALIFVVVVALIAGFSRVRREDA